MRRSGIALAALLALATAEARAAWVQWMGPGATNNWYRLVLDTASDWFTAKAAAEAMGGHLATITSADEQTFIRTTFFAVGSGYGSYWIGATDRAGAAPGASEGTFSWVTGEPFGFAFWGGGQPDNNGAFPFGDGAEGEDFVQFVWRADGATPHQGRWNDARQAGYQGIVLGGVALPHLDLKGYLVERKTDPYAVPAPAGVAVIAVGLLGLAALRIGRRSGTRRWRGST